MKAIRRGIKLLKSLRQSQEQQVVKSSPYSEALSKHRYILNIYDLHPKIMINSYVAPNCSVIGQVEIGVETQVWYGTVIRGDINEVKIGSYSNIGENCVITTAACLPNGLPAIVEIQNHVNIQPNCTLYSCTIEDEVLIGHKTVILEGSRIEKGAVIGPNSVVPPGRVIPSMQLWAGNPVQYVRDLTKEEMAAIKFSIRTQQSMAIDHKYEFLPYNSAYLQKKNSKFDQEIDYSDMQNVNVTSEMYNNMTAQNHI